MTLGPNHSRRQDEQLSPLPQVHHTMSLPVPLTPAAVEATGPGRTAAAPKAPEAPPDSVEVLPGTPQDVAKTLQVPPHAPQVVPTTLALQVTTQSLQMPRRVLRVAPW